MIIEAVIASYIGTKPYTPPETVRGFVVVESNIQKREREEAEKRQIETSPAYKSYAGAEIIGDSNEACVIYAKRMSGISRSLGYAGKTPSQGDEPKVGAIGLERAYGHAVFIEKIEGDKITISEANFVKSHITRRVLAKNAFRGFVYR